MAKGQCWLGSVRTSCDDARMAGRFMGGRVYNSNQKGRYEVPQLLPKACPQLTWRLSMRPILFKDCSTALKPKTLTPVPLEESIYRLQQSQISIYHDGEGYILYLFFNSHCWKFLCFWYHPFLDNVSVIIINEAESLTLFITWFLFFHTVTCAEWDMPDWWEKLTLIIYLVALNHF